MANPRGTPIWFEHTSADPAAAQAFYEAVADWTVAPSADAAHGGYRIASADDGGGVAGLMAPPPGTAGTPGWTVYFAADDVDAAAARVTELGGTVHFGPMDIPGVGRFATCADPQGVLFTLMRGDSPADSQAFRPGEPADGHGVWIELAGPDPDGAFAFYGALFGWTRAGGMPMGDMGEYAFIGTGDGGAPPGAIMSSTTTGAAPRWNWYIHVADIDAAVAVVRARGGSVHREPAQIPGGEYSANAVDPQGFDIGLVGPRNAGE